MQQTSLFQLNLMLWLSWPAPPSHPIYGLARYPLFLDQGYVLYAIEPPLQVPDLYKGRARGAGISTRDPLPDVILRHDGQRTFLPIECKRSSFGPDPSQSHAIPQCLGLLAAAADLAGDIGVPAADTWQHWAVYAVTGGQETAMQTTLVSLTKQLAAAHIPAAASGAMGIYIEPAAIVLRAAPDPDFPIAALRMTPTGLPVMERKPSDTLQFLYLIPWAPSSEALPEEQKALNEQVRITVSEMLTVRLRLATIQITVMEVVMAVMPLWHYWKNDDSKSSVKREVQRYIVRIMRLLRKIGLRTELKDGTFTIGGLTDERRKKVRSYLRSKAYRTGNIDIWTPTAQGEFGTIAAEWDQIMHPAKEPSDGSEG